MNKPLYNIYCDESCHLENGGIPITAWGALSYEKCSVYELSRQIRNLKDAHGLGSDFEAKWTKISPGKIDFYQVLVDLFLADDQLRFRGLVLPDKSLLSHRALKQSHNDWHCEMYSAVLHPILATENHYHIYIDIKDRFGGPKVRGLHKMLAKSLHDLDHQYIQRVQQVHSHESELLQITGILTGALTYANRKLNGSPAKLAIVEQLRARLGVNALTQTTPSRADEKFNVLIWQAQEQEGNNA